MNDQEADPQGPALPFAAAAEHATRASLRLPPTAVWTLAAVTALGLGRYFWRTEGSLAGVVFAGAIALTVGALIVLAVRRILLAAGLVAAMIAAVVAVSTVKSQETHMLLHAYDLVLVLTSWTRFIGLWHDYRHFAVALAVAMAATVVMGWTVYHVDGTRVRRPRAAAAAALFALVALVAAAAKGERPHTLFYFWNVHVSAFFASWSETMGALARGGLIEAASHAPGPSLTIPTGCERAAKPPHIILIHQESVVPPSHFPSLGYDRSLDPFFRSFDGRLRKLRVETYGGASWLTEFSILTGLSARSFGGMRQFVQPVMAHKVKDTLPQALARCGYRSVLFYPMLRTFIGSGRFFEAMGLRENFDAKDQRARTSAERDRFYYANALAEIERHVAASRRPLFTFIETAATHWPYHETYMPEVQVPGGAAGTHPEMHEYLRRLAMARMDYAFLREELARRFAGEPFLIVHYGDHQPTATRTLLGFAETAEIEEVMRGANPSALITYYAVDALNYQPPPLPDIDTIDVPYLGTILLDAARLPLSDGYRERQRLMALCDGAYHGCARREEVLRFHRRLIASGLMEAL